MGFNSGFKGLKCRETKNLQQELLGSLWLNVNGGVIKWEILTNTNVAEIKINSAISVLEYISFCGAATQRGSWPLHS